MKPAVERVVNYREAARGEKPAIEEIFCTGFGKLLGSQVDEVLDFARRGQIILILLPVTALFEKVQRLIADGTYRQALARTLGPEDMKKIEAYEFLLKDVDIGEPRETAQSLMNADDRLWYFSLITFCVYAYLDAYSTTLVNTIASNQSLAQKLKEHLKAEALRNHDDKEREYVTEVLDMKHYGVVRRLVTIETGLSIDKTLSGLADPTVLGTLRRSFSKITDIRHKIAHRNPKLHEEEYSYKEFESELDKAGPELESTFADISESFGFLKPIFGSIKDLALEVSDRIQKTAMIVQMAILYPALLDAVLYELLRSQSSL